MTGSRFFDSLAPIPTEFRQMAFPKHLTKERLEELLSIIERNRWERLKKRQLKSGIEIGEAVSETSSTNITVVLFGVECPFTQSLIEMFRTLTGIAFFDDPEQVIAFCLDNEIKAVLMDIDSPTDVHVVKDVFASLKMLMPISKLFVCTRRGASLEAQHFKMFNSTILGKPILLKQVQEFYDRYLFE
jgi:hypothetical protein